jgi:hypothetical protein
MTLRLNGSTSGYSEIDAPAVAGDQTFTLPGTGGTLDRLNRAGNVIQVIEANYLSGASTSSNIPRDSTIPQNTEGAELLTASITPISASNKLLILVNVPYFTLGTGGTAGTVALFQDTTANALSTAAADFSASDYGQNVSLSHYMTAGTTSSTTFKIRYGAASGSTFINRYISGTTLGGVAFVRLIIMEIAA